MIIISYNRRIKVIRKQGDFKPIFALFYFRLISYMVEVNVDKFYSNRALYPFIPEAVFDALEAAYLSGNECARIPEGEYNTMMSNLKRANLCPVQ